jgi:hypothetical protein
MIENHRSVLLPYLNCTSTIGISGAIERGRRQIQHPTDSFAAGLLEERGRDFSPVLDRRAHRPGFEHQSQYVGRVGHGFGRAQVGEELLRSGVHPHDVPTPVHHDRRVRRMLFEDAVQRGHDALDRRMVEVVFGVDRGEPSGDEQPVAVTQRNVQGDRESKDHVTTGLRPARLDEAHVSRRGRRRCGQVELTHRPQPPPVAHQIAESGARRRRGRGHGGDVTPAPPRRRFPPGEWPPSRRPRMIVAMNLHILTPDDAPAASRQVLDGIAADLGFIPNLAAVTAVSPTLLSAFDTLRRTVSDPSFSPVHREIAGLAVGVAVGVAFHSTVLGGLGVEAADIDATRSGSDPNDSVHGAVYAFAGDVAARRGKVTDDVIRRAHDAGLTDAALLQLVAECVFAGLVAILRRPAGVGMGDFRVGAGIAQRRLRQIVEHAAARYVLSVGRRHSQRHVAAG